MRRPRYFVDSYVSIYDGTQGAWVPFKLWPAQVDTLSTLTGGRLVCILKARQLGLTWLVLAYALWLMLFRPGSTVLLFSRRDDEATELLKRLRGMHERLPDWMRGPRGKDNDHELTLSNGSRALAFPTTGGRSYTATLAIVDEADYTPDLDALMNAVKPTIDAGGQMVLLSTVDKAAPLSPFKRIYNGGKRGENSWRPVFLGWQARPDRDDRWYADQAADSLARSGALDSVWQEYPATDAEAMAPNTLDKRFAPGWVTAALEERQGLMVLPRDAPAINGLVVYVLPEAGKRYVLGADPAEGNPTSDDSALTVFDFATGEECASLAGRLDPAVFGGHIDRIASWYNFAAVLVERNNHGHAVLLWLREHGRAPYLSGLDGNAGWLTNAKGKALLMDGCADALRDGELTLHTYATALQLQSIEGATLRAPQGEHDDRALSVALAVQAMNRGRRGIVTVPGRDPFESIEPRQKATGVEMAVTVDPDTAAVVGPPRFIHKRSSSGSGGDLLTFGR